MIEEIIGTFFTTMGMVWVFLMFLGFLGRIGNRDLTERPEHVKVDDETYALKNVVMAEAEFVEQGSYRGWLLWDPMSKKFLGQTTEADKCVSVLQERFPGKIILIKGLPK